MTAPQWLFAGDRGGTFTDIIGVAPDGGVHTAKLLSASAAYPDPLITGVRRILGIASNVSLPADRISCIRIGTTVATNALLERKGAPTGLLITAGFADLLEIGHQARPRLFALDIVKPEQLYAQVAEVPHRLGADGTVLRPLDEVAVRDALARFRLAGVTSVAVALLHAWVNPAHELRVGQLAMAAGFGQVSLSHRCMRLIKLVGRAQTTVVDAYLSPVLRAYVECIRGETGAIPLEFMQSDGGLATAAGFHGKDAVLSGPAGGVVAVARLAVDLGLPQVIGFDMGGTSTDVCRYGGEFERRFEVETAGIRYQADALNIETVAAGGGSILGFDGERMTVGPHSAGADPGPACYGRGGPLTLTDANLLLGRILPERFPTQFGRDGTSGLDPRATRVGFVKLAADINAALGLALSPEETALGYLRIANEQMAKPIRTLSIARGYDLRDHVLCCFGGAGGLHACGVARILDIERVVIHPLAGLFSAWGIALADRRHSEQWSVLLPFGPTEYGALEPRFDELDSLCAAAVEARGETIELRRLLDLRPLGGDAFLTVAAGSYPDTLADYLAEHERRFGFVPDADHLEMVNIRVAARRSGALAFATGTSHRDSDLVPERASSVVLNGGQQSIPVYDADGLVPGRTLDAPCLVLADHYSVLVDEDFSTRLDDAGVLILERQARADLAAGVVAGVPAGVDPVLLEVFNHRFMGVAEQMGAALVNTAHSVNMKERLDFSCALFDAAGNLIANAPHIPVHLGAMGESVRALLASRAGALAPGEVYVTNHPARGGSHLPDITVISPVFAAGTGGTPDFFVATRGHHADIGGKTPGSMAPDSRTLAEEGVVFDNFLLVAQGRLREAEVRAHLAASPYPARNLDERLHDLRAQLAANRLGERELQHLARERGLAVVGAYMRHVQDNASRCVQRALTSLLAGAERIERRFADCLDDGTPIAVLVTISSGFGDTDARIRIDFTGTGAEQPNSFNAPKAVVRSAVLYVLRCLVAEDIPLNEGCMRAVTLLVPEPCLLAPGAQAAVAAGNVETSQRIVDVLLGALGVAAASQGTMNNLLFGWEQAGGGGQYYETIGGGAGATARADGASGVQVHMTNTRITDPEILEHRYPGVRLASFGLRSESGGAGARRGGDGLIRVFDLLEACELTLLTQRRTTQPFGFAGGSAGAPGRNLLYRRGVERELPAVGVFHPRPGDRLRVETPGGGGFGSPLD